MGTLKPQRTPIKIADDPLEMAKRHENSKKVKYFTSLSLFGRIFNKNVADMNLGRRYIYKMCFFKNAHQSLSPFEVQKYMYWLTPSNITNDTAGTQVWQ